MLALLGEAGVVEDEDALGAGEGLGQMLSIAPGQRLVVPGALVDELLEGLLGVLGVEARREGDAPREGFDALALAVVEQPLEVDAAPGGLLLVGEVVVEDGGIILES